MAYSAVVVGLAVVVLYALARIASCRRRASGRTSGRTAGAARFDGRFAIVYGKERNVRIGPVVCLLGGLLLMSAGAEARRPHAPRCRTGRFVSSSLLTGGRGTAASSDTIVLDAQGKASVTNRCTAARAKLSGGGKSTQLTVRWPAGACRGVEGALKLTATIKRNCRQICGRLQGKRIHRRFKAGRFVCPTLLRETADGLACRGADFTPGAASTAATLDPDGRLSSAIDLTTDHGLTAHLDAGTQVHGRDGEVVTGDIEIVLDDGGGVAAFGGPDPIQAIVRLLARRRSDGAVLRVDFDPAAKVDLEVGDFGLPGTWLVYAYADSDGFVTGPGAGAEQILLGPLDIHDDGTEQLVFGNTMVIGLGFTGDTASASDAPRALAVTPTSTVSVTFPGPNDPPAAAAPDARVCKWEVVTLKTAQLLTIDLFPPGIGVGESRTKTLRGRSYTVALVARGGGKALEVTSAFHNRVVLDFRLCNPDGTRADIAGEAQGGCADETCTDVRYDGQIDVHATVGSIGDIVTVRDALRTVTAAGNRVILRNGHRLPNGRFQGLITVQDEERSVQTVAATLPGE